MEAITGRKLQKAIAINVLGYFKNFAGYSK